MTMPDDNQLVIDEDYSPDIKLGVRQDIGLDDVNDFGVNLAPELVSLTTFQIPAFGPGVVPVTILNRRVTRHRARIWITGVGASTPNGGLPYTANGQATAPLAGANISGSITPAAGTYNVTVMVYLDGTIVTATDDDNMKLGGSFGLTNHLLVPGNGAIATYTFTNLTFNGVQTMDVINNNAGSAAADYHAMIIAEPVVGSIASAASAVVLGKTAAEIQNGVASNSLQGSGLYIANSMIPTGSGGILWESQRECFATAIGGIATITVLDQSYAQDRKAK
jgi:hypothetical protein